MPVRAGGIRGFRDAYSLRYARAETAIRSYAEDLYIVVVGF